MRRPLLPACVSLLFAVTAAAQVPPGGSVPQNIPSVTQPGEQLAVRNVSPQTGFVTFAGGAQGALLLPIEPGASAEARAVKFIELYGAAFGLSSPSQVTLMRNPETDELGIDHVRFQQLHKGIPVRAGEMVVHVKGASVVAANGHILDDLPADVVPSVSPADAVSAARSTIAKHRPEQSAFAVYSEPRLEIFNRGLLMQGLKERTRLAWFIEATGPLLREFIWVDAQSRVILLHFNQVADAKSRQVYNAQHTSSQGVLVRSEGGPATGDTDQDNAYTYAGITYDYYLTNHGRDSYNNLGATIISSAHYCAAGYPQGSTCPGYQNAAWTGTQMVYADGFASADDVVGHELTHAVTQSTAGLYYYQQSGALNESFSDIFGETIDLSDGVGNDASNVRWKLGEDLPNGAIRDMMNPNNYSNPGKMSDTSYFYCYSSGATGGDYGGVHENSGIPNHAYALMVDGGTFNNTTITGIGLTKAAKIEYRTLTLYLTSGSGFSDDFNALIQSCTDLVGTNGITTSDCSQVTNALQAVEMNNTWPCVDATHTPPQCSTGTPLNVFLDTFETATGNWTVTSSFGNWTSFSSNFAKSGKHMAYGTDPNGTSDHNLAMANGVIIPAGAFLYFDHAYEFENGLLSYDGGVLEYTTNNGSTWNDAGGLIDGGQTYNGSITSFYDNPLGGRAGFVDSSYGYTGTRLNLASLAGQSVKFRFRIGSDFSDSSLGWVVDNFAIYTCTSVPSGTFSVVDANANLGTVNVTGDRSTIIGNGGVVLTDVARTANGLLWGIDFNNFYSINPATGATTLIGSLGAGASGMNALVASGNGLYAASINTTSLYVVNTSTGAATALSGSLGFPAMGDLAYHAGNLYAAVKNGTFSDLVRVDVSGSTFTATNLGHVTSDNALFALAEGTDYNLYGVSGTKVLRIDTTNPAASVVVVSNYALNGGLGSGNGAATPIANPFTDDALTSKLTIIRAIHINELRTRINAIRAAKGLTAFPWTDPTLTVHSTKVKAVHVTELRTALTQAYSAAGLTPPTFTDSSLLNMKVKAIHIVELRAAVRAME